MAEDVAVARIAAHPESVRENHHVRSTRHAFVAGKPAAQRRGYAERRSEGRRRVRNADSLRIAVAGDRDVTSIVRRDAFEGPGVIGQLVIELPAHRRQPRRHVLTWDGVVERDETFRIAVRQRVEEHAMHDGEDRRVGTNRQRERKYRRYGECRTPSEPSCGMPDLLGHRIHTLRLSFSVECSNASRGPSLRDRQGHKAHELPPPQPRAAANAGGPRIDDAKGEGLLHRATVLAPPGRRGQPEEPAVDPHVRRPAGTVSSGARRGPTRPAAAPRALQHAALRA